MIFGGLGACMLSSCQVDLSKTNLGSCWLHQFVANGWFRSLKESPLKVLAKAVLIWCCKSVT